MHPQQDDLEKAILHYSEGKNEESLNLYKEIIAKDSAWGTPYYNMGLVYKYSLDWSNSFYYNQKAVELEPENEAGWWNLGIAATMLEEWKIARTCWNRCGMKYEENDTDPYGNAGSAQVRLNPKADGEVVWTTRVDPARAIINSIPFPESNHRYKDLILNDGAVFGTRISNGREYPVLNELQLIKQSDY